MAQWLTGMPAETHLSILALILGGAFDRVDPVCGSASRTAAARSPSGSGAWTTPGTNATTSSERRSIRRQHYLGRFNVDSVVFDHRALRLLVDTIGADRVLLGSDYPYPLGERPAGRVVHTSPHLGEVERRAILRGNAEVFLGL